MKPVIRRVGAASPKVTLYSCTMMSSYPAYGVSPSNAYQNWRQVNDKLAKRTSRSRDKGSRG